ncbi:hypothetical protein Vadar_032027 [Vaccinium darrowii]|uniref:Uncharacterized protein n=1 Tax=Vaccinium darrowii TaxID=229202 RepID=A0ACB7Z8Z2_9ERIC|nr:hypothetical protein Vadar_032027 [Vaccinium darrowii]
MSSRRLLNKTLSLLLLVALFLGNCHAKTSPDCDRPSSSCGNIPIKDPFRVKGDPENCGKKEYELECEHNRLLLNLSFSGQYLSSSGQYLFSSGKYYVQAINYNNYTIRVVDVGLQQGNCSSLPLYYLSYRNFTYYELKPYYLTIASSYSNGFLQDSIDEIPWEMAVALWVDCEKPVKKYLSFADSKTSASRCIGKAAPSSSLSSGEKRHYPYFLFGNLSLSDVADHCKIDEIVMTTLRLGLPPGENETNISFSDFHSRLEFGFELSWVSFPCEQCRARGGGCSVGSNYNVTCSSYCDWGGPDKSFLCRLKIFFWYYVFPGYVVSGLEITGWILGARTSLGMLCLLAYLIYKFMRRHLSMFDTVEDFLQSQNNLMPIRYSYWQIKKMSKGRRRNLNAFADHTSQIYFPSWIYDQFKEGNEIEMGEATDEERQVVRKMVITALWCIQMRPSDRPSMNKVVEMLEGNVEGLEMPPKPFLIPQEMPVEDP